MLTLTDVTVRVAGRPLLEGASLALPAGRRAALVGRNGTGKSTLLKLISGELQSDLGSVRLQSGARIGMIAQEAPGGDTTPVEAVLAADTERAELLAEAPLATDPLRIAEIQARLVDIRADSAPARAARILLGLGFDEAAQQRPLSSFSGGWRMRAALAAVLFIEPDLLLLDEPTNHLDLEATIWLEEHLKRYPRTLLIVSHDRDLLNSVPETIVHLDQRKLTAWTGNYDQFTRLRAERLVVDEKQRVKQAAERAHLQAFVDRFKAKASKARQAQSRVKKLEKLGPVNAAIREPTVRFDFPCDKAPAPPMITIDHGRAGYGDKIVLDGLDLRLDPEDRVALLGRNGNGKSTLAKLMAGRLEPLQGEVTRARSLKVGFFAQHQIEDLKPASTPIEHIQDLRRVQTVQQSREFLARFGLGADKAETKAQHLSGGEKARLAIALMCLDRPNLLILDEPTNHLDIDSRDALVQAINAFPGAVIVISHDRHLVEATADTLWLVADGVVQPYDGDVDDYRAMLLKTSREEKVARKAGPTAEATAGQNGAAAAGHANGAAAGPEVVVDRMSAADRRSRLAPLRKQAKEAEMQLQRLTAERATVEAALANPKVYGNGKEIAGLQRRGAELTRAVERAEAKWLEVEAQIEGVAASA